MLSINDIVQSAIKESQEFEKKSESDEIEKLAAELESAADCNDEEIKIQAEEYNAREMKKEAKFNQLEELLECLSKIEA